MMLRRVISRNISIDAAFQNELLVQRMRENIKTLVSVSPRTIARRIGTELEKDLTTLEKNVPFAAQVKEVNESPKVHREMETAQKLQEAETKAVDELRRTVERLHEELGRKRDTAETKTVDELRRTVERLDEELGFVKEQRKKDTADILVRKMHEDSHRLDEAIGFMKTAAGWCVVISLAKLFL